MNWETIFPQLSVLNEERDQELIRWNKEQATSFYFSLGLSWRKEFSKKFSGNLLNTELQNLLSDHQELTFCPVIPTKFLLVDHHQSLDLSLAEKLFSGER